MLQALLYYMCIKDTSTISDFAIDAQRMLLETANAFEFDSLHQLISTSSSVLFIERLLDWVIRF